MKGVQPEIMSAKKQLKEALTILQIHPCYLIKLYQHKLVPNLEFYKLIKEIYSYQNERTNYLLMSVIQGIIDTELKRYDSLE